MSRDRKSNIPQYSKRLWVPIIDILAPVIGKVTLKNTETI